MDTQALLDKFRALDIGLKKRTQEVRWQQAEIVYQVTPGPGQSPTASQYTLEQLGVELNYSPFTLSHYRQAWQRHGGKVADYTTLPDWTLVIAEIENRAPMRERMAAYDIERIPETATPEQKVKLAARLMADPTVVAAADDLSSPVAEAAMALVKVSERRSEARTRAIVDDSPLVQSFDRATALERLSAALVVGAGNVRTLLENLRGVELDPRYTQGYGLLREGIEQWEQVLEDARSVRDTGKTTLDRFTEQTLKGV